MVEDVKGVAPSTASVAGHSEGGDDTRDLSPLLLGGIAGLGAFGVLNPVPVGGVGLSLFDERRFIEMGAVVLVLMLTLVSPDVRRNLAVPLGGLSPWHKVGLAFCLLWGGVSAVVSADPSAAFIEVLAALGLVLVVFLMAGGFAKRYSQMQALVLVGVVAGIAVWTGRAYAAYLWHVHWGGAPFSWVSPFFDFANVRFFSQVQTWTLPLLAIPVLAVGRYSRTLQGLLVALGAGWWSLHLATGSRGTWAGLLLAVLVVALVQRRAMLPWLKSQALMVALGGLVYMWLFAYAAPGVGRVADKTVDPGGNRLAVWREALVHIGDAPLLGVGPMHFADRPENPRGVAHPHNSWLQIAGEWGLPVAFVLSALAVAGLLGLYQGQRQRGRTSHDFWPDLPVVWSALPVSLLAGLVHSGVSGIIVMPASQWFGVLVVGWTWGLVLHHSEPQSPSSRAQPKGWRLAWLAGAAGIGLCALIMPMVLGLEHAEERFIADHDYFSPRFWLQGRLEYPPWAEP